VEADVVAAAAVIAVVNVSKHVATSRGRATLSKSLAFLTFATRVTASSE
jgi:hypothetical protein